MKTKFGIILGDCHIPHHDAKAWALALKVIAARKPDMVVQMGDLLDIKSLMSHQKSVKDRSLTLKEELTLCDKHLDALNKARGKARMVVLGSNHEQGRLTSYMQRNAPELEDMWAPEDVFGFKKRGWEYHPYQELFWIGKLALVHDLGAAGANAHRDAERMTQASTIIGHVHRTAFEVVGNVRGRPHIAAAAGWLGDRSKISYMPSAATSRYWSHSIFTFHLEANGHVHLTPCPFVDGKVLVDGKLYGI